MFWHFVNKIWSKLLFQVYPKLNTSWDIDQELYDFKKMICFAYNQYTYKVCSWNLCWWKSYFWILLLNIIHRRINVAVSVVSVRFLRYKMILKNKIHSDDEKYCCSELLALHDKTKREWQLGKTKVQNTCTHLQAHTCARHVLFLSHWSDLLWSLSHFCALRPNSQSLDLSKQFEGGKLETNV